jgi:hypothetical protein
MKLNSFGRDIVEAFNAGYFNEIYTTTNSTLEKANKLGKDYRENNSINISEIYNGKIGDIKSLERKIIIKVLGYNANKAFNGTVSELGKLYKDIVTIVEKNKPSIMDMFKNEFASPKENPSTEESPIRESPLTDDVVVGQFYWVRVTSEGDWIMCQTLALHGGGMAFLNVQDNRFMYKTDKVFDYTHVELPTN